MEVSCQTVNSWIETGREFLLLDCREQPEVETVSLPNATWIPMSELEQRANHLESHRQTDIVVFCHLGGRSLQVAMWLRQQGYENALSMEGGIDRWAIEIDESLPRY